MRMRNLSTCFVVQVLLAVLHPAIASKSYRHNEELYCSACSFIAESLRSSLTKFVKTSMKAEKREKAVTSVLESACKITQFPRDLVVKREVTDECLQRLADGTNPDDLEFQCVAFGARRYWDLDELKEFGADENDIRIDKNPRHRKEVAFTCEKVLQQKKAELIGKVKTHVGPIGEFNWERWLCVNELKACETTLKDHSVWDEDEEEKMIKPKKVKSTGKKEL